MARHPIQRTLYDGEAARAKRLDGCPLKLDVGNWAKCEVQTVPDTVRVRGNRTSVGHGNSVEIAPLRTLWLNGAEVNLSRRA